MDWQAAWDWLSDESNRAVLRWLGGAFVVVVAAGWAVFKYLHGRADRHPSPSADELGRVPAIIDAATRPLAEAIGKTAARTETKVDQLPDAVVDKLIAELDARKREKAAAAGIREGEIITLARRIKADVPDYDQALAELTRAVELAVEVLAEGARGGNVDAFIDAVLARIAEQSRAGRHDDAAAEADRAFAEWEAREAERRDQARQGGLTLLEAGLKQDILRRDPAAAAGRVERMVALEHPDDPAALFEALRSRWHEWYERGRDRGLNFDLAVAIALARLCRAAAGDADQRGMALNDLGTALQTLGAREAGAARLEEAVEACRAALEEGTRKRVPRDWAMTQNNLGLALATLGEREAGTARLEEAVAAYRAALEEYTLERVPLDWAATQNNLGLALLRLGEREAGTPRLEEAMAAFRAALQGDTRERVPLQWAATQNNLGNALLSLGEREAGTLRLVEAVKAYRAALQEYTRKRVPLSWAMTQNNMGLALLRLGEREAGTAHLVDSVKAYRASLEEHTRERVPLDWAATQNNLGNALLSLGEREAGTARLVEAVTAYRAALEAYTRERVPLNWAMTQNNLGLALLRLGEREAGTARLEEAVTAYRAALEAYTRERVPLNWAITQNNLGLALVTLGDRESDRDAAVGHLSTAVGQYRAALAVFEEPGSSHYLKMVQRNLARTEALLSARRG